MTLDTREVPADFESEVIPTFAAELRFPPASRRGQPYRWFKTLAEWLLLFPLMLAAAPVILICAVIIKLTSPGPVFYSQMRLGRGGKPFRMHKLRSMPVGSEAATGPVWSIPGDPRVTRFGRFLRDTHLDELPQLWNVLKCEMSLIGPRPERPEFVDRLERALPRYRERLQVRPGLTGLAQMQLPPDITLECVRRKLAFDLHYIKHIGLWLDLRIAASTVFYMFGVLCTSACRMLMKPERQAAERGALSIEVIEEDYEVKAG